MANWHDITLFASLPVSTAADPAEGDAGFGAYDAFFREQYDGLLQFLRKRSRTEQDAEDAAQESLARFIRYAKDQPRSAWKPVLYRIAINVANDQLRRARAHCSQQHVPLEGLEIQADQPGTEEEAVRAQERELLREAIRALPPRCRQVYVLKRLRGLSSAQIANHCGISVRMVEKHLAAALHHIRRRFGQAVPDAS